ncbi:DNA-directed RNA polymerase III subunit RPC5-like isoform X1 [Pistacia vera]|uniref:DNA-directed RNA polymerase III subunit RPC5-like isoform X1 n=1 Tax=Pistacia vera TaxID=55513 RepID=UPI001263BA04|nr:DNA-directed RNA polymerase III subunit RPC5-like isoform X1 [Pistacia vera]
MEMKPVAAEVEMKPAPDLEAKPKIDEPVDSSRNQLEEEEDMIVREIDVYYTPSIDADTQLYVMQYPLRPCWRPYELDERCEEVRVKHSTAEVEMDLSIDVDSSNWDSDRASRANITKQTLSSSWKPSLAAGYAVGVLVDNKLVLNPIHAVVQLRPSIEQFKSGGSKRKNNVPGNAEVAIKLEDSNEAKHVGLSKKQNKRIEASAEEKRTHEDECWVPLKYHGLKSDFSARYLQRMLAQESSNLHFTMNPYEYVSSLCPGACDSNIKSKSLSRRFFLSMPLEERVRRLLLEGPPVNRFSALQHFASDDSIEDLLGILQKHAQLVQGLWVPRSLLLFEDKATCLARDFVLLLFSKNLAVKSEQLLVEAKLKDHIKRVLNVFAVERPSFKDWKFKEHRDASFIKEHPDIVKKQEQVWANVEKQINDVINRPRKVGPSKEVATRKSGMAGKPLKVINSDEGASAVLSGKPMSNESREALPKALQKIFQMHKVCSKQFIRERLREWAVARSHVPKQAVDAKMAILAADGVDTADFEEVISQVATNIHGYYVSKSSSEHPEYDQLRKVVINLLLAGGPDTKLKKADVIEAARLTLKRDNITENEYKKVMSDICESKGGSWVLKKQK